MHCSSLVVLQTLIVALDRPGKGQCEQHSRVGSHEQPLGQADRGPSNEVVWREGIFVPHLEAHFLSTGRINHWECECRCCLLKLWVFRLVVNNLCLHDLIGADHLDVRITLIGQTQPIHVWQILMESKLCHDEEKDGDNV